MCHTPCNVLGLSIRATHHAMYWDYQYVPHTMQCTGTINTCHTPCNVLGLSIRATHHAMYWDYQYVPHTMQCTGTIFSVFYYEQLLYTQLYVVNNTILLYYPQLLLYIQLYIYSTILLPYSGFLSREKTSANFAFLWRFKVFSVKIYF